MDKTLNQVKSDLKEIATQHRQINDFFFGSFLDAINQENEVDYTLMCCTIQPASMGENFVNINLNIVIADKYNEDDFQGIDEIHSDCLQICRDIYVTLKQTRAEEYLEIDGDVQTTPFISRGADITAGWAIDISLKVFDNENWCGIPYDSYDFGN